MGKYIYISKYLDMFFKKKSPRLTKPALDTIHDVMQMLFRNLIINGSPVPHTGQKSTSLHQSQVIRGGWLSQIAGFGQIIDRIPVAGQATTGRSASDWDGPAFSGIRPPMSVLQNLVFGVSFLVHFIPHCQSTNYIGQCTYINKLFFKFSGKNRMQ